ncbi:hypothetical protein [Lysinibacillus sp. IITD104]
MKRTNLWGYAWAMVGLITAGFDNGQNLNLAVPANLIYQIAQNFIELVT